MSKKKKKITSILVVIIISIIGMIFYLSSMMTREAKHGLKENNATANLEQIDDKLKITYMGDSLTAGYNSNGKLSDFEGYRRYVREELQKEGLFAKDYNFAVGGYIVEDLVKQLENNVTLSQVNEQLHKSEFDGQDIDTLYPVKPEEDITIKDAIKNSDVLVLTIGANNVLESIKFDEKGQMQIDINELISSLYSLHDLKKDLFAEIHKINPDIKIFDVGMYMAFSDLDEDFMQKLYPLLVFGESKLFINDQNSKVYKVTIRDNMQANLQSYIDNPDDIHPNIQGYKVMGNEILKKISQKYS